MNHSKKLYTVLAIIFCVISCSLIPCQASTSLDTKIPKEYVKYCEEIGNMYCLSPELLEAIIEHESRGIPTVGNSVGCYGLMGISAKWNADRMARLGVTDLYDPYSNILVGADLLAELFEEYEDDYEVLNYYGGYQWGDFRFAEHITNRVFELEVMHEKHPEMDIKG